jgi:glycosyltransferase involved in cell wall biosynthesis
VSCRISVIIPAYREEGTIRPTVDGIRAALLAAGLADHELIVIDDGSPDDTAAVAERAGATVVRHPQNQGKGQALLTGFPRATGDVFLLLDGDLGDCAREGVRLLEPILTGEADMTLGVLPVPAGHRGGFGMVKKLARWGVRRVGGPELRAPLSGQRGLTRAAWRRIGRLDPGYGIEMGLNLDAVRCGLRMREVPVEMQHRLTGRNWSGFRHRGRQFRDVALAILRRAFERPARAAAGHREGRNAGA